MERILTRARDAGRPVPVVPLALKGMWSKRDREWAPSAELLEARVRGLRGTSA